jgi:hypothetical protein
MGELLTFVKTIHVQLPHEGGYVGVLEILSAAISHALGNVETLTPKLLKIQCWGS